jgi:hypothetical protein
MRRPLWAIWREAACLYDKAVAIVARERKVSTSYIQRRLQIGYTAPRGDRTHGRKTA